MGGSSLPDVSSPPSPDAPGDMFSATATTAAASSLATPSALTPSAEAGGEGTAEEPGHAERSNVQGIGN